MNNDLLLTLEEKMRVLIDLATAEHAVRIYMLAIAILALGFVAFEVARILRAECHEFMEAKTKGAIKWHTHLTFGYLAVCAVGQVCHYMMLVAEAYRP